VNIPARGGLPRGAGRAAVQSRNPRAAARSIRAPQTLRIAQEFPDLLLASSINAAHSGSKVRTPAFMF